MSTQQGQPEEWTGRLGLTTYGLEPDSRPATYNGVALMVVTLGERVLVAFDGNGQIRYRDSAVRIDITDCRMPYTVESLTAAIRKAGP